MSAIQDFREQYPQYAEWSDEDLGEAVRVEFYSDMPVTDFREQAGLPSLDVPAKDPDPEPTFAETLTTKLREADKKSKVSDERLQPLTDELNARRDTADYIPDGGGFLGLRYAEAASRNKKARSDPEWRRQEISRLESEIGGIETTRAGLGMAAFREETPAMWRDQFFAGWDEYRSNRAATGARDVAEAYHDVEDVARGKTGAGGVLGVSGKQITKQVREAAAIGGDPQAKAAIRAETKSRRLELAGKLQELIDHRTKLSERAATVPFSPVTQSVLEAETFSEGLAEAATDPISVIAELSIRSAPQMAEALPMAMLLSIPAGPIGFGVGMGLGSGRSEYRASYVEALEAAGVDTTYAPALLEAVENSELMAKVDRFALTRAGIIGTADAISGGIAGRTLTPFIKNLVGRELLNAIAQTGVQGALGGAGEAGAQLATTGELRPGEILAEAFGEMGTAPIEVGVATVTGVRAQAAHDKVKQIEAEVEELVKRAGIQSVEEPSVSRETDDVTVFHGTPHEFNRFRTEKIGTGEGNQAFGYGLYVADSPGVARSYQADLADYTVEGRPINESSPDELAAAALFSSRNRASAIADLDSSLEFYSNDHLSESQRYADVLRGAIEAIKDERPLPVISGTGRLYEAQIPAVAIQAMLDWDAPLSQQPESVRGALEPVIEQTRKSFPEIDPDNMTGRGLYKAYVDHRGGNQDVASETLRSLGIPGIKYLDANSRDAGEGTRNYVVFNADDLTITKRDEKPFEGFGAVELDYANQLEGALGVDARLAGLAAIKEALNQADVQVTRKGDRFVVTAASQADVTAALELAEKILSQQTIMTPQGRKAGINVVTGTGSDATTAVNQLREKRGARANQLPPDIQMSRPGAVLDMQPGTNYVPMIGQIGDLPLDADLNYVLGNGRTVRIPKEPIRQADIIKYMERKLGLKIYKGRIKGKTKLGFYRPGQGELRTKDYNNIEVTAHEIAHWFDDRNPWIGRLYKQFADELKAVSYDKKSVSEGYAEFMRLFMTQDREAMKRAPGFYDAWRGEMSLHPKTAAIIDDLQEYMHAWTQQGVRARHASKHGATAASIFEKIRRRYFSVNFWQSALDGLKTVRTMTTDLNDPRFMVAYKKLRIALGGSHSVLEAAFLYGTPGWRADGGGMEITGDGLAQIFGKYWGDEGLALYMMAKHGEELHRIGKENLQRPDEIADGLRRAQENPDFAPMFERYQQYRSRMLTFAEGGGILGAKTRDLFEEMYKAYVPFHRVIESTVNKTQVSLGGSPFQRLKGGTQNVNNLWDNMINNDALLVRAAMINDGKRSLFKLLSGTGEGKGIEGAGKYAAPIQAEDAPVSIPSQQVLQKTVEAMGLTMAQYRMAKEGMIAPGSDGQYEAAVVASVERMKAGMDEFVTFFQVNVDPTGQVDYYLEDGKKVWFEIGDPGLYDSLQFLGPKGTNWLYEVMGAFSATLRRGVVSVPIFQVGNFTRDSQSSWLLSSHVRVPVGPALVELFNNIDADPMYQEMLINGGGFSTRAQGLEAQRHYIVDPTKILAAYDRALGRVENAPRMAEYRAGRKAGLSPRDAAFAYRNISTDFAMRGSSVISRILAIGVPFMNARFEGNYRIGYQLSYKETAMSYAMRGAAYTAFVLALYMRNKDDERYKELPDDIKDLYLTFYYGPGEDDFFRLKKPFESGALWGTVPERLFKLIEDREGKEFVDAMGWMLLETFAMDPTFQVFQPELDIQRNKNFTGAPIIPSYLENVDPAQQYRYYTSLAMKEAGKKLGISPIKMEYRIRGYTGYLGQYSLAMADALIRATTDIELNASGERPTRGETWKENILTRLLADQLISEGPPRRTISKSILYDMIREAEQAANTVALMTARRNTEVEQYLRDPEKQQLILGNPVLQDTRKAMNEIRQEIDAIRLDNTRSSDGKFILSGDEKRVRIWALTREQNKIALKAVAAIREQREKDEN